MATYTNKNGTDEADILVYDKGGSGVIYHTGTGNDKVTILDDTISLVNDGGNVTIDILGGAEHTITGSSNIDTINIQGGNAITADLGSGRDVITIVTSNGKTGSALSAIRGGEWTDTFNTEAGALNYQLYGDAGDDIFNIKGGSSLVFWGGAANDTFNVTAGTGILLRGGDSADVYNISTAKVDMQLGYGNDVVNVTAGNGQTIKANLGINQINLKAGSGHVITSDIDQAASKKAGHEVGYGVDKVYVSGTATNVTANLGDGKDIVEVSSGTGHKIYTEGWGDSVRIFGNVTDTLVRLGAGDDDATIEGGSNITVYGEAGNDTIIVKGGTNLQLNGGAGDDKITIAGGSNLSLDLTEGQDTLTWKGGSFKELKLNATKNIINFAGVNGARFVTDSTSNSVEEITISQGSNLYIDTKNGDDRITITGGNGGTIYGGEGNDTFVVTGGSNYTLYGRYGYDTFTIKGGTGITMLSDYYDKTFIFEKLEKNGSYKIDETFRGSFQTDSIKFPNYKKSDFTIVAQGNNIIFTHKATNATITVERWFNSSKIYAYFDDGKLVDWKGLFQEELAAADTGSQVGILKSLMKSLDRTSLKGYAAMDEAINYASKGKYITLNALVSEFEDRIIGAQINSDAKARSFLLNYCGINLDNKDTGAISGLDCGGTVAKTAESIVLEPQGMTVADFTYTSRTVTARDFDTMATKSYTGATTDGLTFYWNRSQWSTNGISEANMNKLVGGLVTTWTEAATKLVNESYGLSFKDSNLYTLGDGTKGIQLNLYYSATDGYAAYVSHKTVNNISYLMLNINTRHYGSSITDINGDVPDYGGLYLDRILAHELTHGAMVANITATSELPVFFREGAAELVHGADDYRSSDMLRIIKDSFRLTNDNGNYTASQRESLEAVYSMTNANSATSARYSYSAGYSLLRYFAKQVYDEYNNVSPVTAANNSELMNAVLDFAEPTVLSSLDCHQEENLKLQIAGQSN